MPQEGAPRLPGPEMWILESTHADYGRRRTFRLLPGRAKTIGRARRADFVVDTPMVSRVHCRLVASETHLEVEDLESTNGTFVNGARVERGVLTDGDRLQVGRLELAVLRRGDP